MPKVIYIEPKGYHTPLLFDTFKETFSKEGYEETTTIDDTHIAFVDLYSWLQPIEGKEGIVNANIALVFFDFTDFGGMSKEEFNYVWYEIVRSVRKIIVFVRKLDKTKIYPPYVYPIEHIIEQDFPTEAKDDLCKREYDFCFIGNTSPQRQSVVDGLLKAGFKGYVHWTNEKGKIPHHEWLDRHRQAKMFLTADGGGFSDERIYQLGTIAIILKQKNNHLQLHPFQHGYDCREVSEVPTEYEIEHLKKFLTTPQAMYQTYLKGAAKLRRYYSPEHRANYILAVLKQNGL